MGPQAIEVVLIFLGLLIRLLKLFIPKRKLQENQNIIKDYSYFITMVPPLAYFFN